MFILWGLLAFTTWVAFMEASTSHTYQPTPFRVVRALLIPLGLGALIQTAPQWIAFLMTTSGVNPLAWLRSWPGWLAEIVFLVASLAFLMMGVPVAIIYLCHLIAIQVAPEPRKPYAVNIKSQPRSTLLRRPHDEAD